MTDDPAGYAVNDGDGDEVSHSHPLLDMHADAAAVFLAVLRGDATGVDAVVAGTECPGCLAITLVRLGWSSARPCSAARRSSRTACPHEYIRLAEQAIAGYQEGLWHQPR